MQRKVIARYQVVPATEEVTFNRCSVEKDESGVPRVKQEVVTEVRDCFYVHFPKGHSIRVTSLAKLKELGFDKKPRLIDAETGDLIDIGGENYDFVHEAPKSGGKSRVASPNADAILG
jgi:hypothetical protein